LLSAEKGTAKRSSDVTGEGVYSTCRRGKCLGGELWRKKSVWGTEEVKKHVMLNPKEKRKQKGGGGARNDVLKCP